MTYPTPQDPSPHDASTSGPPPQVPAYGQPSPGPQYSPGPTPGSVAPYQNGITAPDDKTWVLLGYLGQFVVSFVAPLVVYISRKDQSPFVKFHMTQALNMSIEALAVYIGGLILGLVTLGFGFIVIVPLWIAYGVAAIVYTILAAVKANDGELYTIPKWLAYPVIK